MSGRDREPPHPGGAAEVAAASPLDEIAFNDALAELEQILGRIEREDVDLDRLASELGRAAELLEVCRRKIRKAELEVSHIVEKLGDG
ncbi:MAG TPA: exodeoxyribonuclease VII small subunit [Thermoanaerobaculia bacterium]|nr:exodeoxyribonuclease VII small subunit [Thermoanaerobaculia bacterium]